MSAAAPTIALTVDDDRAAVRLEVGLAAGADTFTLWRISTATGNRADVRGYVNRAPGAASTWVAYDYEAPLGVELVYQAQSVDGGVASPIGSAAPVVVDGGGDWLVDLARPTNSMRVLVEALPRLAFEIPAGVQRVLDRRDPVLTAAPAWTPIGTLVLITATDVERDRALTCLGNGVPVLLRTPPIEGVGNLYFGVTALDESRVSRLALHADRRITVELAQVERPDPELFVPLPPLTYRQRLEAWATYADVAALGVSYQELAYTFTDPDAIDPWPPWLPSDV